MCLLLTQLLISPRVRQTAKLFNVIQPLADSEDGNSVTLVSSDRHVRRLKLSVYCTNHIHLFQIPSYFTYFQSVVFLVLHRAKRFIGQNYPIFRPE